MFAMSGVPDSMSQRVLRNSRFELVEVSGEIILYDSATHDVIYLDRSASVIWFLCDGERSVAEISRLIAGAYPESRDTIADDVRRTVSELAKQGALTLSS
jgi:hypothetical protein